MKLTPFTVRMLTMNRWFDISNARKDLKYEPIIPFKQGWKDTLIWFKQNWLPKFLEEQGRGVMGLSKQTEQKIDSQVQRRKAKAS